MALYQSSITFNVLIATCARVSLKNMLNSLKNELNENDAITIIFDGQNNFSNSIFSNSNYYNELLKDFKCKITTIIQETNLGFWGHPIRNKYQGSLEVKTTFIVNADDDDTYIPGSFDMLRKACIDPNTLYIGKMRAGGRLIPSQNDKICFEDIGTPCGIIPFDIASKSIWEPKRGGDFFYYNKLQEYCSKIEHLDIVFYKVN